MHHQNQENPAAPKQRTRNSPSQNRGKQIPNLIQPLELFRRQCRRRIISNAVGPRRTEALRSTDDGDGETQKAKQKKVQKLQNGSTHPDHLQPQTERVTITGEIFGV